MEKRVVTHRLTLDLSNQKLQATVTLAKGDAALHRVVAELRNGAESLSFPPGSYALAVKNKDASIDVLDAVTLYGPDSAYPGCVVYDVTAAVTGTVGVHEAQFVICYTDDGGAVAQVTSPRIAFVIKEGLASSSAVLSAEPYQALVMARDAAKVSAEAAAGSAKAASDSEQNAKESAEAAADSAASITEEVENALSGFKDDVGKDLTDVEEALKLKANATYDAISALLGIATAEQAGAMSAKQAQQLATLVALLENEDADTTINTIREVLAAFAEMPEGTALANALAGKVDKLKDVTNVVYTVNSDGELGYKYYAKTLSKKNYATVVVRDGATQTFEVGKPREDNHPVRLVDLNDALGDIEGALDEIIAAQDALIGGTA